MTVNWSSRMTGVTSTDYEVSALQGDFRRYARVLLDVLEKGSSGTDESDFEAALSYFGFSHTTTSHAQEAYDDVYVTRSVGRDFQGMSARPEWVQVDDPSLARQVARLTDDLRKLIALLKADNGPEPAVMPNAEKKQLLVVLEEARLELSEGSHANKSALRGLALWLGKLSRTIGEKYLTSQLGAAMDEVGTRISDFVRNLPAGSFKLPW